MKILFLHGWGSTPGGVKPTCLRNNGHEVVTRTCPMTTSTQPSASPKPTLTNTVQRSLWGLVAAARSL